MPGLPRTRPRVAALSLAVALTLTGSALAGCGDESASSPDPTPSASGSASAAPADGPTRAVFFVGATPQGPRLYRELHRLSSTDPLTAAVTLVASGEATDPDYSSLFPPGAIDRVSARDGGFDVRLTDDSWARRPDDLTAGEARLAVQQVVYTLQALQETSGPVRFYVGDVVSPVLGIDAPDGVRAAPQLDVLALVDVIAPEEGTTVTDSFEARGMASSFEATVPWEIRRGDASGAVVARGFATADGWMDRLYPWRTTVDVSGLPAGDYTFVAMTDDPSGGEGGGPVVDTTSITVS